MPLTGRRLFLAVAQKPFENDGNCFATLAPVLYDNGDLPDDADFPNNGLVWWMVRPSARRLADPGRLICGILEHAHRFDPQDPGMTYYQIQAASAVAPSRDDLVEILSLPTPSISSARELVAERALVTTDHPCTDMVFVRWREKLYGPLRATSEPAAFTGGYSIKLSTPSADHSILQIPESALSSVENYHFSLRAQISLDSRTRGEGLHEQRPQYELLIGPAVQKLERGDFERIVLESNSDVLRRISKDLLSRRRRQELLQILRELKEAPELLTSRAPEEIDLLQTVQSVLEAKSNTEARFVQALVESGLLDSQLENALTGKVEEYINSQATKLRTEIEIRISDAQTEYKRTQNELTQLAQQLESRRKHAEAQLETELRQLRANCEAELKTREERLNNLGEELARQQEVLSQNLAEVTEKFLDARAGAVNQFLAIEPFLQRMNLTAPPGALSSSSVPAAQPRERPQAKFELPPFISKTREDLPAISEVEFFNRFKAHVENSGMQYRDIDLLSFHLSVKCSDITVLGGVPGTGKSTLPRLYAQALAGSDWVDPGRYLMVGVSPSWLDMRDLIGHVNALDGQFYPAESGLYQWLLWAQRETDLYGDDCGMYLACLDEMNLAHVEHYFSGFLQALEQRGRRQVRCFSSESVAPDNPFAEYGVISIPRSIRFVGTVNFDETTKQLSLRLLDRTNLVHIRPGNLADIPQASLDEGAVAVEGPPITERSYRSWKRTGTLDGTFAELIDELRVHLDILGSPLNPRRFRSLCDFVASAPAELCSPAKALDLQIAQRLLPQVRGVFGSEASEALDRLESLLEKRGPDFSESLYTLGEIRRIESDTGMTLD